MQAKALPVLENIKAESCLLPETSDAFFGKLKQAWNPTDCPWEAGIAVVKSTPTSYLLRRSVIDEDRFTRLFRVERPESLRFRVKDLLDRKGIREEQLRKPDQELLQEIVDEGEQQVTLGNLLGIVWCTELQAVEPLLTEADQLLDRLGIDDWDCPVAIAFSYSRTDSASAVHVPSALDGINMSAFRIVSDCVAPHGETVPIRPRPDGGVPEGVHGAGVVSRVKLALVSLK